MKKEVKLQARGRITIPKSFRQKMRLKKGDTLILELCPLREGQYLFAGKQTDVVFDLILRSSIQ